MLGTVDTEIKKDPNPFLRSLLHLCVDIEGIHRVYMETDANILLG